MGVYRVILELVFLVIVFTSLNGSYGDVKLDNLSILRLLVGQHIEKNQIQGKQRNEQSAKSVSVGDCTLQWTIPLGGPCDIARRDAQKQKMLNLYNNNKDIPAIEWKTLHQLSCLSIHPCRNGVCTCVNPITYPPTGFVNRCLDSKVSEKDYNPECDRGTLKEESLPYVPAHECEKNWKIPTKQSCDNKKFMEVLSSLAKKPMNKYTDEDHRAALGVICSQDICENEVCSCETLPCKDDEPITTPDKKCNSSLLNKPLSLTQIFIFNIISWLLLTTQLE